MSSAGRVIIVTGAESGLGFHVAKTLAEDTGNDVIMTGSDQEQMKNAVEKIKESKQDATVTAMTVSIIYWPIGFLPSKRGAQLLLKPGVYSLVLWSWPQIKGVARKKFRRGSSVFVWDRGAGG